MEHFKAIIFDLDGTLLDTLDDLADSMNRVLKRFGLPMHPVEEYKYFVGDGIEKLAYRVLPEAVRKSALINQCAKEMRKEYGANWHNKTRLYDGIADLLTALSQRTISLNILSNKPHSLTDQVVKAYLSPWKFNNVVGANKQFAKKPDPAGAYAISEKLGIPCKEFLYIGDTNTDMLTARRAGMYALGVLWGFRESEELKKSGAQTIVGQPLEILPYI